MAKDSTIKTRLTLDGEKEFKQKIRDINQELRAGDAELKKVAAAFDLNGNAQSKLTNTSRILKEQLDAQKRVVGEYAQRLREAKAAGDISEQGIRNLEIALNGATAKFLKMRKASKEADREVDELGRDSRRAGDQIEDNLGDAADEVGDKFDRMVQKIQDDLGDIRSLQGISLAVDITRGAIDVGQSLYNFAEQNREYNINKAKMQQNVRDKGGDVEAATRIALEYMSVFQDEDSAWEAVSNFAAAGYLTGEDLRFIGSAIAGAANMFQETIKPEGLADSLQETISSGVLTGQIDELFTRLQEELGIDKAEVAEGIANARAMDKENRTGTDWTRSALNTYLERAGLGIKYENFVQENEALLDAAQGATELKDALAELSATVDESLTPVVNVLADAVRWLNEKIDELRSNREKEETAEKVVEQLKFDFATGFFAGLGSTEEEAREKAEVAVPAAEKTISLMQAVLNTTSGNLVNLVGGDNILDWISKQILNMFGMKTSGAEAEQTTSTEPMTEYERKKRELMSIATGEYVPSAYVTTLPDEAQVAETAKEINQEIIDAAADGVAAGAMSLVEGLNAQTGPLLAIAEMQREMLAEVWRDPITPTVVVGYASTGGKPNLPPVTGPSQVNVTVELDKRPLGQVMVDLADQGLAGADGGAFGAMVNKYDW